MYMWANMFEVKFKSNQHHLKFLTSVGFAYSTYFLMSIWCIFNINCPMGLSHPRAFCCVFHSPCALWPSFCLSLIVSWCSGVSHHYVHLRSPYKLLSFQCFFVRSRRYMCVFATLLYWITSMWIIKDGLSLFFIVVLLSRTTPWQRRA